MLNDKELDEQEKKALNLKGRLYLEEKFNHHIDIYCLRTIS